MAGRPAAAPRGGGGGMLYGLITFVITTVACLGLFIWQLTDNKRLVEEANRAKDAQQRLGSPKPYYDSEARNRGTSVLAVMNDDMEKVGMLIAGKQDVVPAAIQREADRLLTEVATTTGDEAYKNHTVLTALSELNHAYDRQHQDLVKANADLEQLRAENQSLADGVRAAREEFVAQVADLKTETERIDKEKTDQLAAKDAQLARIQADSDSISEELSRFRVEKQQADRLTEVEVARLNRQVEELRAKIASLRPGGFDQTEILTKADGKVLRAIPGSDVVFINIGSKDRVRPGLTFEVFSPEAERRDGFRGKASIEVNSVSDDVAECRVTRTTSGRPIVENDIIVNIAYERNRKPKFVVRGEFDLDYDGVVDWDGLDKVTAIVRGWGGQVVENVDETTDFVVVGMGPHVPSMDDREQVGPLFEDLAKTQEDKLANFRGVIDAAKTLNIPIVVQNQFLFLTGYAGREDVVTRR